jgi:hypothetical protein
MHKPCSLLVLILLRFFFGQFETIYTELEKEIECVRTENELTECLLNDPNTINIWNMVKALKEMKIWKEQ